jgi:hypothetical protein
MDPRTQAAFCAGEVVPLERIDSCDQGQLIKDGDLSIEHIGCHVEHADTTEFLGVLHYGRDIRNSMATVAFLHTPLD